MNLTLLVCIVNVDTPFRKCKLFKIAKLYLLGSYQFLWSNDLVFFSYWFSSCLVLGFWSRLIQINDETKQFMLFWVKYFLCQRGTQFWQNKNAFFKLGNDFIMAGRTFTVLYGSINWPSTTTRTVAHASNFNTKKIVVLNHPLNLNFNCTIIAQNFSKRPSKQDPLECISTIFFKTHKLLFIQWKNAKIN